MDKYSSKVVLDSSSNSEAEILHRPSFRFPGLSQRDQIQINQKAHQLTNLKKDRTVIWPKKVDNTK